MIMVRLNHSVRARPDRLSEAISVGKCELSEQEREEGKNKSDLKNTERRWAGSVALVDCGHVWGGGAELPAWFSYLG